MKLPDWCEKAVIYQIFPDRYFNANRLNDPHNTVPWDSNPTRDNFFGGDLEGIIEKLDEIRALGADTIYLNPVFLSPSNHKYDTWDYYQVDPCFGGNKALKRLILSAHNKGMKICLDGVFNHSGEYFFAFQDVKQFGPKSQYWDWYFINNYPITKIPLSYHCCGDADFLPKLNYENQQVQDYFIKVGKFWVKEFGIDGWRLDVPFKIPLEFWQKFRTAIKTIKPDVFLFGEVWRDARHWMDGTTFDGVTNYPLRALILDYCQTFFLDAEDYLFEAQLLRNSVGGAAAGRVNLLGSHDTPRLLTLFKGDVQRVLIAWVLLLTEIGIPLIYYGDEVGMEGDNDPDCRRSMIWASEVKNREIYDVIQPLLSLRHQTDVITRGTFENLYSFIGLAAYKRKYQNQEVIVIVNPRDAVHFVRIPIESESSCFYDIFTNQEVQIDDGHIYFDTFPRRSFRVLTSFRITP